MVLPLWYNIEPGGKVYSDQLSLVTTNVKAISNLKEETVWKTISELILGIPNDKYPTSSDIFKLLAENLRRMATVEEPLWGLDFYDFSECNFCLKNNIFRPQEVDSDIDGPISAGDYEMIKYFLSELVSITFGYLCGVLGDSELNRMDIQRMYSEGGKKKKFKIVECDSLEDLPCFLGPE
jgi:hypothetical protein